MIEVVEGDIFESGCEVLVNPVNCVGVMGAGLALKFKQKFPRIFESYKRACQMNKLKLGEIYFIAGTGPDKPYWIAHFPTKNHWNHKSCLVDIGAGLSDLASKVNRNSMKSVAMPAIGCGLGGLDWEDVIGLIRYEFRNVEHKIKVYKPR